MGILTPCGKTGAMARDVKRLYQKMHCSGAPEAEVGGGSHFTAVAVGEQTGASLRADGTSLADGGGDNLKRVDNQPSRLGNSRGGKKR